jgi:competence protein ComEC
LPGLLNEQAPRHVYLCDYFARDGLTGSGAAQILLSRIKQSGAEIVRIRAGDVFRFGSTRIDVLWPISGMDDPTSNDTSLVLRLTCAGRRILLTGDIGQQAMTDLLASGIDLKADVLLLPHHGGWDDALPAFFDAVDPHTVLVSASRDPRGPSTGSEEVRNFYRRIKAERTYYSTATDGWIGLTAGPDGLHVETMR